MGSAVRLSPGTWVISPRCLRTCRIASNVEGVLTRLFGSTRRGFSANAIRLSILNGPAVS
jgi:hypothetical protein